MPLEPDFDHIDDLDPNNPFPDDPVSEGDDHLRGIKSALQGNVTGDDTETRLLVAGLVAALVDAGALTVLRAKLDLDNSGVAEPAIISARNLGGGWRVNVLANGDLQFDEIDENGAFVTLGFTIAKAGAFTAFHNVSNGLRTAERTAFNSSAEIFDFAGLPKPVGFNALPFLSVAANLTVDASHNGKKLRTDNVARTISYPANLPEGFCITQYKGTTSGAALDTINATAGATFRFYNGDEVITGTQRQLLQGGVCTISWTSPTVYDIWGNGGLT